MVACIKILPTQFIQTLLVECILGSTCAHRKTGEGEGYGDIFVDTNKSHEIFKEWLAMTRPASGKLRRTLWFKRAFRPDDSAYIIEDKE